MARKFNAIPFIPFILFIHNGIAGPRERWEAEIKQAPSCPLGAYKGG